MKSNILGLYPCTIDDLTEDEDFMKEIQKEVDEYGETVEDALTAYISDCYEDDYNNIEQELKKHYFYYYHVAIKPGVYEGFALDIESNFSVAFDSWEDKREAQKEITEIKQFLIECASVGLAVYHPERETGCGDYNETITAINEVVEEMRRETIATPTWRQYKKSCS